MARKNSSSRRKGKTGGVKVLRPEGDDESFNVFIGWSGSQSRQVALALREWLPSVIQSSRPWMSDADIDKGTRWEVELANQLSQRRFGIICLTPENLDSRWVLFEAGAMSRDFENRVAPYILGLSHADIKPPLTQFQTTTADRDDTKKLVLSINRAIGSPVDEARLGESFDVWWPKLDERLTKIPRTAPPPKRGVDEILDEILDHVRELRRASIGNLRLRFGAAGSSSGRLAKSLGSAWMSDVLPGQAALGTSEREKFVSDFQEAISALSKRAELESSRDPAVAEKIAEVFRGLAQVKKK